MRVESRGRDLEVGQLLAAPCDMTSARGSVAVGRTGTASAAIARIGRKISETSSGKMRGSTGADFRFLQVL